MKKTPILTALLVLITACADKKETNSNLSLSTKKKVEDLMKHMSLEEKVGQMCQWTGLEYMKNTERGISRDNTATNLYADISVEDVKQMAREGKIGSFLHVLTPQEANELQALSLESRLQIPFLIGTNTIRGNGWVEGTTIYPTSIGQAAMFDTDLVEEICRQTAMETRAMGAQWTFNPNVEVARNPRWGRVEETFGEDPYLVARLGVASVIGYQGIDFGKKDNVLACAKYFAGGSQPVNGSNGTPGEVSERTLREVFFPPFKDAVEAGVFTVMQAHNELNGIPCHSNEWLMKDVLRKEWSFEGFIVSDWMDLKHLYNLHHTAVDNKDTFFQAVDAGMDMHMHGPGFYEKVIELVREGKLSEKRIDETCKKILYAKFQLGLFDNRMVDLTEIPQRVFTEKHRETALEAAKKSIVLLTNNGILPLKNELYKNVLVVGPNANNQSILGNRALPQPEENVTTVLEGLRAEFPEINFSSSDQGWNISRMSIQKITEAEALAKKSDLAIIVAGKHTLRNNWHEKTSEEDCNRSDINRAGLQQELIDAIADTGIPVVVILVNGRQLAMGKIAKEADALIEAWEPGCFGGQAIAEILSGKVNPSAKLPVTIPRHAGQLQMIYDHKPSMCFHPDVIGESTPLFAFGYGLSYTTFDYDNLKISSNEVSANDVLTITVDVTNTGKMDGEEIAQLYVNDVYASVTRPVKELKGFKRVFLKKGERKTVEFILPVKELVFSNKMMQPKVEKGEYLIMAGASSMDEALLKTSLFVK